MSQYRILLAEDEKNIADMVKLNLELEGYHVVHVTDGRQAIEKFRSQAFGLGILDVMMPGADGFTVCQTIRLEGNAVPILFLSARGSGKDRIDGLKIGGNDYLTKPFHLEELLLRVRNLIQRHGEGHKSLADMDEYSFGPYRIHFSNYTVYDKSGVEREISRKEIMLLKFLIQSAGQVVSREEILEKIWGYDIFPSTRTIDNFILAFRKYFEPDTRQPRYFHTVRGVGYRFTP